MSSSSSSSSSSNKDNKEDGLRVLDVSNASTSLWLVKVPAYIAEALHQAQDQQQVGTFSSIVQNNAKRMVVAFNRTDNNDVDEFFLNETPIENERMIAFDYNDDTGLFAVKGNVTKKSMLQPKEVLKYKQTVMNRSLKASVHNETQLAPMSVLESSGSSSSCIIDFIPPAHLDKKRKQGAAAAAAGGNGNGSDGNQDTPSSSSKRGAKSEGGAERLKSKVFEAFETTPFQTAKDLQQFCREIDMGSSAKEKEIKTLLDAFAKYHAKGLNRGFWELKPEYKQLSSKNNKLSS